MPRGTCPRCRQRNRRAKSRTEQVQPSEGAETRELSLARTLRALEPAPITRCRTTESSVVREPDHQSDESRTSSYPRESPSRRRHTEKGPTRPHMNPCNDLP